MVRWRSRYSRKDIGDKGSPLPPGRSFATGDGVVWDPVLPRFCHSGGARILPEWLRRQASRDPNLSRTGGMKWKTPRKTALLLESASPPSPADQGAWTASTVTAKAGGCIFAAAPSAATLDAAIHLPRSMPVPTRAPPATLSYGLSNPGRNGSTITPRRSSSVVQGFRIPSPGHLSSQHLHRQTRYPQTGVSACTGNHGPGITPAVTGAGENSVEAGWMATSFVALERHQHRRCAGRRRRRANGARSLMCLNY
jgi:hypothetical protein